MYTVVPNNVLIFYAPFFTSCRPTGQKSYQLRFDRTPAIQCQVRVLRPLHRAGTRHMGHFHPENYVSFLVRGGVDRLSHPLRGETARLFAPLGADERAVTV